MSELQKIVQRIAKDRVGTAAVVDSSYSVYDATPLIPTLLRENIRNLDEARTVAEKAMKVGAEIVSIVALETKVRVVRVLRP